MIHVRPSSLDRPTRAIRLLFPSIRAQVVHHHPPTMSDRTVKVFEHFGVYFVSPSIRRRYPRFLVFLRPPLHYAFGRLAHYLCSVPLFYKFELSGSI